MLRILHISVGGVSPDTAAVWERVFLPYGESVSASLSATDESSLRKLLCTDAKGCDLVLLTGDAACCRKAVLSLTGPDAVIPLALTRRIAGWMFRQPGRLWVWLPDGTEKQIALLSECVLPLLPEKHMIVHTVGIYGPAPEVIQERLAPFLSRTSPACCLYRIDAEWRLRLVVPCGEESGMECTLAAIRKQLGAYLYGTDCPDLFGRVQELLGLRALTAAVTGLPPMAGRKSDGINFISEDIPIEQPAEPGADAGTDGQNEPDPTPYAALRAKETGNAALGLSLRQDTSASRPTVRLSLTDGRRLWNKTLTGDDADTLTAEAESALWDLARRYLEAFPLVMAGGEPVVLPEKATDIPVSPLEKEQPILLRPVKRTSERAFRVILVCMLVVVLCLSAGLFTYFRFFNRTPINAFRDLEALYRTNVSATDSDEYPKDMLPQFYSLYKENADIAGWIRLDNKTQSYPVMNGLGSVDYGSSDFAGQPSSYGVPFFFPATPRADKNDCLIIYGNHMTDNTMFSCLLNYLDDSYARSHAQIEMTTVYRTGTWQVFAALTVDENESDLNFTRTAFTGEADRLQFVRELTSRSKLTITSEEVENEHELLLLTTTLSSDPKDTRRVVVAFYRIDGTSSSSTVNVTKSAESQPDNTVSDIPSSDDASSNVSPDVSSEDSRPPKPDEDTSEDGGTDFIEPSDDEDSQPQTTTSKTAVTTTSTKAVKPTAFPSTSAAETESGTASATSASNTDTPTSATLSTTSVSGKTTTSTTAKPSDTYVPIREGTIDESEYYPLFRLKNSATEKIFTPTTREELTLGLFYIVKMEMGSASLMKKSTEAQKAQAVASYTFVLYYCQNSGGPYEFKFPTYDPNNANDRKIYSAVAAVAGTKMIYPEKALKSQAINAMYCASSAGVTSSCHMVFTAKLPYLVSVKSQYDTDAYLKSVNGSSITAEFTVKYSNLLSAIGQSLDLAQSEIYAEKGAVPLFAKTWDGGENGYVYQTNLYYYKNGKKTYITGKQIRNSVNKHTSASMRSHAFTVTAYDSKTDIMTIQTRGHGHGLGLSQYGAVGYANEAGWTYDRILAHYYSITETTPYQLVAPKF